MKPKEKTLPEPSDPNASFCTVCPYCKEDDELVVTSFTCMTRIRLGEDGFSTADAKFMETQDEMVFCDACSKTFPLSEVTR